MVDLIDRSREYHFANEYSVDRSLLYDQGRRVFMTPLIPNYLILKGIDRGSVDRLTRSKLMFYLRLCLGCVPLLFPAPVLAQNARQGAYVDLVKGKFVHAAKPRVKNGLPFWIYGNTQSFNQRKQLPLLIVLHGRRNNVKPTERFAPQAIATPWIKRKNQNKNPCFVVQPYYPPKGGWEKIPEQLDATITDLVEHLPIDPARIYLMGFSNGAQGTFQALARDPGRYAAAITVSGPVRPDSVVGKIKTPIRAWVGENDHSLQKNKRCIALARALKDDGVDIELVVVKGAGHSCHHVPTGDPDVHAWLFSQKRIVKVDE